MLGVIDVLAMQREKNLTMQQKKTIPVDYRKKNDSFTLARFIFECGLKLEVHPLTIATAASHYHKFMRETSSKRYDPFLIASACLYIAVNLRKDQKDIDDIMNVTYHTLHRNVSPLEGDRYWNMQNAILQTENVIKNFNFQLNPELPHKYMLHFLRSLQVWIGENEWSKYPIARTSMALLQDFHHTDAVLDYPPNWIAIACINLSFQIYGVTVPLLDENSGHPWYNIFSKELQKNQLWEVMEKIMASYDNEPETKDQ